MVKLAPVEIIDLEELERRAASRVDDELDGDDSPPPPARDPREHEHTMLLATLEGDTQAERAFVEQYRPLVQHCVRQTSSAARPSEQDVEDMESDVWLSLWENDKHRLRRYEPSRQIKLATWIGLLARNRAIDWLRSEHAGPKREEADLELMPAASPTPSDELLRREGERLLWAALDELAPEERALVEAWYIEEEDTRELARRMGVAVATVYSRRFKAVAKLARTVARIERRRARRQALN